MRLWEGGEEFIKAGPKLVESVLREKSLIERTRSF